MKNMLILISICINDNTNKKLNKKRQIFNRKSDFSPAYHLHFSQSISVVE